MTKQMLLFLIKNTTTNPALEEIIQQIIQQIKFLKGLLRFVNRNDFNQSSESFWYNRSWNLAPETESS